MNPRMTWDEWRAQAAASEAALPRCYHCERPVWPDEQHYSDMLGELFHKNCAEMLANAGMIEVIL